MRNILSLFICTFCIYILDGQIVFNRYTTEEGLPHDITYEVIQDDNGFIWIGTEIGLVKFDGKEFSLYNTLNGHPIGIVTSLLPLSKDSLAIGTWGKGVKILDYDGNELAVVNGTINDGLKLKSLTKSNGVLYSSPYCALIMFDNEKQFGYGLESYILSNTNNTYSLSFENVIQNLDKNVKFNNTSIDDRMYYLFEPKQSILSTSQLKGVYYTETKLVDSLKLIPDFLMLKNKYISCLQPVEDIILAGSKDTIYYIKRDHNQIEKTLALDLKGNYVLKIVPYSKNEFVFTTINNKGIKYVFLYDKGKLINLNTVLGLKNSVSDIMIDNEESIWITSYGDGIFHIPYRQKPYEYLDKNIFSDPNIVQITKGAEGQILMMATDFLYVANTNGEIVHQYKVRNECKSAKLLNGKLIALCTNPELKSYSKDVLEMDGLNTNIIEGVGVITLKGKTLYINERKVNIDFETEIKIVSITIGKKPSQLWVTDPYSLFLIDYVNDTIISKIDITSNFCGTRINNLFNDGDTLWVGTDRCLNAVVNNKVIEVDLEYDGNLFIYDIKKDKQNNLWVATQLGLFYKDQMSTKKMTQYTGLLSDYCKSIFIDDNNKIWVSGNAGVTIIDPKYLNFNAAPKFNVKQNNCHFDLRTITFNRSKSVEVQYKLSSSNKWTSVIKNKVDFCDLKPDSYAVDFRYRNSDANWQYSSTHTFSIILPWQETWWGISTLVFIVLGIFLTGIIYRLRNINKRNKVLNQLITEKVALEDQLSNARNNIAMDFHDDMGNKMARISLLSEMLTSDATVPEDQLKSKLNQIRDDANVLYKNTKDFIWALKSDSNHLTELITYISDFGEDLFYNLDIEFDIHTAYKEDIILPFHWNRHIVLICKEVMTNATKHASCNHFTFAVTFEDNTLVITLKDNGIGMNLHHLNKKSGLSHIEKRMETIGGTLKIDSRPNNGTTVILTMKMENN